MKRIKSFVVFICGIVLLVLGAVILLWRDFGMQGVLRTLLGIEFAMIGASALLGSFSYEAVNNDKKCPPDERSDEIRMRAKAWSFDIVTWIMMMLPPILRFFLDTQTSAIAAAAIYGVLAFGMLLKSALLIFYERNM